MAVESPNRSAISPLRFFNRTARVSQPGSVDAKNKLIEIDSTLKKILSIRKIEIDKTRLKKEEDKRVEKENKLEAGKFIVKGIGKLANKIPGKNTIQKFLIFMAFGWLYNTFSKYFDQFVGPLSTLINFSAKIIDVFAKITFSIFDGIVTFIDLGYKAWDVIRGKEDAEKLESAMNDVLLGVDRLFGGILTTLGILEQPINESPVGSGAPATPKSQQQAPPPPDQAPPAPGAPGAQPQTPMVPQAPGQTFTGGIVPSTILGSKAGMRKHPLSGGMKMHRGNDYPIDPGTQISVLKGGKVTRSEVNGSMTSGYGNLIEIQHDDGSRSAYAHLNQRNVSVGDVVKPGTVIGTVGSTGGSSGPHLHFEYDHPNGTGETNWQSINSKADQIFRFGNVKPSDVYKLALKNNVEGVVINGEWKPQKWTKEERDRYLRVRGLKEQEEEQISSAAAGGGNLKLLLDMISSGESPGGGYTAMFPSESHPQILGMTINEVIAFQKEKLKDGRRSAAIGRYQMLYPENYAAAAGLSLTDKFSPENQDKMVIAYLKKNRKLDLWLQGKISDEAFSEELAREFGTFKSASGFVLPNNTGSIDFKKMKPVFNQIKQAPTAKTSPQPSKPTSKPERWAIDPRGWFGMKEGGEVPSIEKPEKKNISPLSSYPSYSEGSSVIMAIQPIIIEKKVPIPVNQGRTSFA